VCVTAAGFPLWFFDSRTHERLSRSLSLTDGCKELESLKGVSLHELGRTRSKREKEGVREKRRIERELR